MTHPSTAGEANYQSQFHLTRLFCCRDFAEASRPDAECSYSLHETSAQLFSEARRHRASGMSCLSYAFRIDYGEIMRELRMFTAGSNIVPSASEKGLDQLPTHLVLAAGVHPMKYLNASDFRSQVDDVLRHVASREENPWLGTAVSVHGIASPNATAIAAGHHPQTTERVTSFNEQLRAATDSIADGWRLQRRSTPRFLDLYTVTRDAPPRFAMLDSLHFSDMYYQTVFVLDALVLAAADCNNRNA